MAFAYTDILGKQRPVHDGDLFSRRHPRMARLNRAKIFAPFAALTGFDDCIRARERVYEDRRTLSSEAAQALNGALNWLKAHRGASAEAVYFDVCTDRRHAACGKQGRYRRIRGVVRGIDSVNQTIRIGETAIAFEDLCRLRPIPL